MMVLTKLRVHHGLPIATIPEVHLIWVLPMLFGAVHAAHM